MSHRSSRIRLRGQRGLAALALALLLASCAGQAPSAVATPTAKVVEASAVTGGWISADGGELIRIEPTWLASSRDGKVKVTGFIETKPGEVVVLGSDGLTAWRIERQGRHLLLTREGGTETFLPKDPLPAELRLEPVMVSPVKPVTPERIEEIQHQLADRTAAEQALLRAKPPNLDQAAVTNKANERWLRGVLDEAGWIDPGVFGPKAAWNAFMIIQHGSLELQLGALPWVQKAFEHEKNSEAYALLYDRTQVRLGKPQRYGTQIGEDADHNPIILPLEDPDRVDELRAELGLPPLDDYLDAIEKFVSHGKRPRLYGDWVAVHQPGEDAEASAAKAQAPGTAGDSS